LVDFVWGRGGWRGRRRIGRGGGSQLGRCK
jgi:hypothetical protein